MSVFRPALFLVLASASASAQPIIIPLEKQPAEQAPPVASAPPVAPPVAGPTLPSNVAEGRPTQGDTPSEEAYAPPPPK